MRGDLKKLVKKILELYPDTRECDMVLTYKVWECENPMILEFKTGYALKNFKIFGVSSIESVGRCRRKLQGEFPELRASDAIQKIRQEKELDYLAIARSDSE